MATPIHSSNLLYNTIFNTSKDFTVSFNYTLSADSPTPVSNSGFSVFFINGITPWLSGGGSNWGLGVVDGTNVTSTSAVSSVFLTVGFDNLGNFFRQNSMPVFTTGVAASAAQSVGIRITTDFTYVSSVNSNTSSIFELNIPRTIRIGVRKGFRELDVYKVVNENYIKVATFQTMLSTIPSTAKFGIGYSGGTLFQVSNITVNCN